MMRLLQVLLWLGLIVSIAACRKTPEPAGLEHIARLEFEIEEAKLASVHPEYFGDGATQCSGRGLILQGFGWTLDKFSKIEYIGNINLKTVTYYVYYYERNANHGQHAIMLLDDVCSYFGSYPVKDRPRGVIGNDIVFNAPKRFGNSIHFAGISPPAKVVIDGDIANFSR